VVSELHHDILAHAQHDAVQSASTQFEGFNVTDVDVLEPDPIRSGGLVQAGLVRFARGSQYHHSLTEYCSATYIQGSCKANPTTYSTKIITRVG
jgi:hypothetical protein